MFRLNQIRRGLAIAGLSEPILHQIRVQPRGLNALLADLNLSGRDEIARDEQDDADRFEEFYEGRR